MRRLMVFAGIGVAVIVVAFCGYFAYDRYETNRTVDQVYDWMQTHGKAGTSKEQIRSWIGDVQSRYGISSADARKAVRDYTVGSK